MVFTLVILPALTHMNILAPFVILLAGTWAQSTSEQDHMSHCLPAVRKFMTDGSDSVEWLFEKANEETDVVILYLTRMCFFHHPRSEEKYDMAPVFKQVTDKVASFDQDEFDLLSEAVRLEIVRGQYFQDYIDAVTEIPEVDGTDMLLVQIIAACIGLGVPLYMWKRQRGTRTKQD